MTLREKVFAQTQLTEKVVNIEGVGDVLFIAPSAGERFAMYERSKPRKVRKEIDGRFREVEEKPSDLAQAAEMIIATAHDPETREKAFTPADRDVFATLGSGVVEAMLQAASEVMAIGTERQIEEAEKN